MNLTFLIALHVMEHPGVIQGGELTDVFVVESKAYGRQRAVTAAVANARKNGWIQDVERCDCCGRATTRGRRNGRLYVTQSFIDEIIRLTREGENS